MKPAPLDEFPVHQTPLSMAQVSTSDRNFHDRNYFNAPDRSGDADGRVEQLGWPRMEVDYRAGTRHPEHVRLHLTTPRGEPLLLEIDTLLGIPLSMGSGYVGDPAWPHGHWKGRDWSESVSDDMTSPDVTGMLPYNVVDHVARARCSGAEGWGMFEHANMGRHDPSGFTDWVDMAE